MSVFKCKMCGGDLQIEAGATVAECEYCGTKQTLPRLNDERIANLYDRANHFRRNNDFDKAMSIYEKILIEDSTDAEAYWSLVLCRFGIEYVEDPQSHRRVPTVNRVQFTSIFDDDNYRSALKYADISQRVIYEKEAKEINEIQKNILLVSQNEEPFDIFICYKETDNQGRRTPDSVLAQELYYQLTQEEFKVFFSRITLEDKLGTAYEPYIFAALNSAKIMIVLGTKAEYFNAVWVKNEWSRYLALIKQGQKKMLIPAYKDMDPYDLPEEFSHLQAQDMSKLGYMQDLIRGIKKILGRDTMPVRTRGVSVGQAGNNQDVGAMLRRAAIYLEDSEFKRADEYAERVLDKKPESAEAYIVKLLVELKLNSEADLANHPSVISGYLNYQRACRFASPEYKKVIEGYNAAIVERISNAGIEKTYVRAVELMRLRNYEGAIQLFRSISQYKDSLGKIDECNELINIAEKDEIYNKAIAFMKSKNIEMAISLFESIRDHRDSWEQIKLCIGQEEAERLDMYNRASSLFEEGEYGEAFNIFSNLKGYKDSDAKKDECKKRHKMIQSEALYSKAVWHFNEGRYTDAVAIFSDLNGYKDSEEKKEECTRLLDSIHKEELYNRALKRVQSPVVTNVDYERSLVELRNISGYKDVDMQIRRLKAELDIWLETKNKAKRRVKTEAEQTKIITKRQKIITRVTFVSVVSLLLAIILLFTLIIPFARYFRAEQLFKKGRVDEAYDIYRQVKIYGESKDRIEIINGMKYIDSGEYKYGVKKILGTGTNVDIIYNTSGGSFYSSDDESFLSGSYGGEYKFSYDCSADFIDVKTPMRSGYVFAGWMLDGYSYDMDDTFVLRLRAIWIARVN